VAELEAEVVVLSLPDGEASRAVAAELGGAVRHVVDTSTIGVTAAREVAAALAERGIGYVDAPVSGGVAGARARTLVVMFAGRDRDCAAVEPVLAGLSDRRRRVGEQPGQAQALKLANNFLSAVALAATSEALAFGTAAGLDAATMIAVLDESSGRSAATADKFPDHVLTGRFAAGFTNTLMAKDLALYLAEAGPGAVGEVTAALWSRFAEDEPGADFTRIAPWLGRR
jgi:3-hydroxyisobutyrate dehydrogenase-like beta-hydroxyacid dehydrogenase